MMAEVVLDQCQPLERDFEGSPAWPPAITTERWSPTVPGRVSEEVERPRDEVNPGRWKTWKGNIQPRNSKGTIGNPANAGDQDQAERDHERRQPSKLTKYRWILISFL
jgi:hypothetical protein